MFTCERCGISTRAQWKARDAHGHELTFCAHHASVLRPALMRQGWALTLLPGAAACARG